MARHQAGGGQAAIFLLRVEVDGHRVSVCVVNPEPQTVHTHSTWGHVEATFSHPLPQCWCRSTSCPTTPRSRHVAARHWITCWNVLWFLERGAG